MREDAVGSRPSVNQERRCFAGGMSGVEDVKHHAYEQEKGELSEHHNATDEQRLARLFRGIAAEVTLHHQLIRSVRRSGQERASDQTRPKRVAFINVQREIQEGEFARRAARADDLAPSARNAAE